MKIQKQYHLRRRGLLIMCFSLCIVKISAQSPLPAVLEILTPKAGSAPRINGPKIFGVRPGSPLIYTIPVTGERPLKFEVSGLPGGAKLDREKGRLFGSVKKKGLYKIILKVSNTHGENQRELRLVVGDTIALTPPMGWNSWNVYAEAIDQEKVVANARAMAESGLIDHGWSYINIDDVWQGKRGGKYNAIQPNPVTFPDIAAASREIHDLGLKIGIYSSPWIETYGRHIGGSANNPEGTFEPAKEKVPHNIDRVPYAIGKYHFASQDARQWAKWKMDYLKYDWNPNLVPETKEMDEALRATGRDMVFSLSNSTPFRYVADLRPFANSWRTGGDIVDTWPSLKPRIMAYDKWAPYAAPGHWNDPDMMVLGYLGWGKQLKPSRLTPNEQYTHMSAWCLLSAPLLLGCDLTKMDAFTYNLLSNDEVLDVNQDPLGKQATVIANNGVSAVLAKDMEDGSKAVGLFNMGDTDKMPVSLLWSSLHLSGKYIVRDLWRQKDLGVFDQEFTADVEKHGVLLISVRPLK